MKCSSEYFFIVILLNHANDGIRVMLKMLFLNSQKCSESSTASAQSFFGESHTQNMCEHSRKKNNFDNLGFFTWTSLDVTTLRDFFLTMICKILIVHLNCIVTKKFQAFHQVYDYQIHFQTLSKFCLIPIGQIFHHWNLCTNKLKWWIKMDWLVIIFF